MTIGIAADKDAVVPDHEFAPQPLNGWPLFGKSNSGHVPLAAPDDSAPIEVGIDITPLLKKLALEKNGNGKLFVRLGHANGSEAVGELRECAIRTYEVL